MAYQTWPKRELVPLKRDRSKFPVSCSEILRVGMNVRHSKHHGRCVEKIQHYLTGVKERTERTGIGNFQYNIQ